MIPDAHRTAIIEYLLQTARDKGDPAPDSAHVIGVIRHFFHDNPKATTAWLVRCLQEKGIDVPHESIKAFLASPEPPHAPLVGQDVTPPAELPPARAEKHTREKIVPKKVPKPSASKARTQLQEGAKLLASLREKAGMSPQQMDMAAGFPPGTIERAENAERRLYGGEIARIYKALGRSISLEQAIALDNAYVSNPPIRRH